MSRREAACQATAGAALLPAEHAAESNTRPHEKPAIAQHTDHDQNMVSASATALSLPAETWSLSTRALAGNKQPSMHARAWRAQRNVLTLYACHSSPLRHASTLLTNPLVLDAHRTCLQHGAPPGVTQTACHLCSRLALCRLLHCIHKHTTITCTTPPQDTDNTTLSVTSACRLRATCLIQQASTHAHLSCHTQALPRPPTTQQPHKPECCSTHLQHTQDHAKGRHTPLRCLGECQARLGLLTGQLHIGDHLQLLHGCNDIPGDVNLPPLQAVARAGLKRMVVVVPTLTPSQQTNPPAKQRGQAHSRCTQQHVSMSAHRQQTPKP